MPSTGAWGWVPGSAAGSLPTCELPCASQNKHVLTWDFLIQRHVNLDDGSQMGDDGGGRTIQRADNTRKVRYRKR